MNRVYAGLAFALVPLLASCTSASSLFKLQDMGPGPAPDRDALSVGYLRVYSATEPQADGDASKFYPHTGYVIRSSDGKLLEKIPNARTPSDEDPELVALPQGTYIVQAQSQGYGKVTLAAIIKGGRTTIVHLDGEPALDVAGARDTDLVELLDGTVVGWRSQQRTRQP